MPVPILPEIVRQHAEEAAFLWSIYDYHLLYPDDNEEMDEERLDRVIARLEAHLDGLRIAGAEGLKIAEARYAEFSEPGELFVVRMLQPGANGLSIRALDLDKVRGYLRATLPPDVEYPPARALPEDEEGAA